MTSVVALAFAAPRVAAANAQSTMAVGLEAGALKAFDESTLQIGLRAAPGRGGFTSVDFSFATFPEALSSGTFLFLMDLGITHGAPRDSSPVYFFPHGGVSLITAGSLSGSGGGGAAVGFNIGAGLLILASPHVGLRADYTYRRFGSIETPCSSITASLMYVR